MNKENFEIVVYGKQKERRAGIIMPPYPLPHEDILVEIKTGKEDMAGADGLWTKSENDFKLGVATADCAPIVFVSDQRYGILHAGWRGVICGIIERAQILLKDDTNVCFWVGPIFPKFEIQKDKCYDLFEQKFGSKCFVLENDKIYLDFKKSIQLILPEAEFDTRSTYEDENLSSWRRDQDSLRNFTVVGKREKVSG